METFYYVGIARKSDEALIESFVGYEQIMLRKADFTPKTPFEMRISEGRKLYDIVGFQDTSNFAISERLYLLFNEHRITGWKGYEIKISDRNERYYGFQVTGKCGKLVEPKEAGFYTGYKFDYNSWDRSDFFSPDDTVLLFCNEKVRNLLKKNRITNIELININAIQVYSGGNA